MQYPWRNADYDSFAANCPDDDIDAKHACASRNMAGDALAHLFKRYERRRSAHPEFAPLRAMRLYHVEYRAEQDGHSKVVSKELAAEWQSPQ